MTDHERARDLMFRDRVEGLASADRQWLGAHLDGCPDCQSIAAGLDSALRGLSFSSVAAPAALVSRTQTRVAERAAELRAQRAALTPLHLVSAVAVMLSVVSTPFVWRGFEWLAAMISAPATYAAAAFLFVWAAPAIGISLLLIAYGSHRGLWMSQGAGAHS